MEFDMDVRSGLGYALETVASGICELFEIDEKALKAYDPEAMGQLPFGASALFAIIYSLTGFLMEPDDEVAAEMLHMAAKGFEPAVLAHLAHMGIFPETLTLPKGGDDTWN